MKFDSLRSLGLKTDIEIARFENKLTERENYLVVESPGNPDYYWGNFLVFPNAPTPADKQKWPELFRAEFAHNPKIEHMAFTWDSPQGEEGESFRSFVFERSPIYHLSQAQKPERVNETAEIRALATDQDWEQATQNQVASRAEGFEEEGYLRFKTKQMQRYRRMTEANLGNWYGAFLDGELVADAGLFHFGALGRFQAVETHPDYRNRGICSALIYHMAQQGLKRSETLVIVADPSHGADRIYRSIGFGGDEISVQITRRAPRDQS